MTQFKTPPVPNNQPSSSTSSPPLHNTTAQTRLTALSAHLNNNMASAFTAVPLAPADPLFGLMAAYKADTDPKKVDLGVGAYRDDNAKPWVLPVVKKVLTSFPFPASSGTPRSHL